MSIIVDGTTVKDCDGVLTDGTIIQTVTTDSTPVYTKSCEFTGCVVFDTVGTHSWDVPSNVSSTPVCMVAGGGGGGATNSATQTPVGGGYAGQEHSSTFTVTPGGTVTVKVGAGGARSGDPHEAQCLPGYAGGTSSFGSTSVSGGAGGTCLGGYNGSGGAGPGGCGGGGYRDGTNSNYVYGGQASSFGSGGNQGWNIGQDGGIGAGGGAGNGDITDVQYGGYGGRGEVRIGTCTSNVLYTSNMSEAELVANGIRLNVGG